MNEIKIPRLQTFNYCTLVLIELVLYLLILLLNFALALTKENGTGRIGLAFDLLDPNLQLLGVDAAVVQESALCFNICRFHNLDVGHICYGVCEVHAESEYIHFGLFRFRADVTAEKGEHCNKYYTDNFKSALHAILYLFRAKIRINE